MSNQSSGTIPQAIDATKSVPQLGEPYNYSLVLDTVQVPRVVYTDKTLSPGARLLWGVIRRLAYKTGRCFATDARLAEELAVSDRQIRRYSHQLIRAGLMRLTEQLGKPTCRELLWSQRFQTSEEIAPAPAPSGQAKERRRNRPARDSEPRTYTSGHPGHLCPASPDISVRPILSGVLEASLEKKPLPLTPSPETGIEAPPENGGSGKGEQEGSAAPGGLRPAPLSGRVPALGRLASETNDPLNPYPHVKLTEGELLRRMKSLLFWWNRLMEAEAPIQILESVARIMKARRVPDVEYHDAIETGLKAGQIEDGLGWIQAALTTPGVERSDGR